MHNESVSKTADAKADGPKVLNYFIYPEITIIIIEITVVIVYHVNHKHKPFNHFISPDSFDTFRIPHTMRLEVYKLPHPVLRLAELETD